MLHFGTFDIRTDVFVLILLIMVAFLLVLLAILCYSIFFVPAKSGENIGEYIKDIFNTLF